MQEGYNYVSFYWKPEKIKNKYEDQQLMMKIKGVKEIEVAVVETQDIFGLLYLAYLSGEALMNNGWAKRETAIKHVEKRFGIYKKQKV